MLGPYVAKQSMGGAGAWATVVTGEAIGALAGGLVALRYQPNRSLIVIGLLFTADRDPERAARGDARRSR